MEGKEENDGKVEITVGKEEKRMKTRGRKSRSATERERKEATNE